MMQRLLLLIIASLPGVPTLNAADHPNILWLSTEDMSPNLGCYGDQQARTPHIDQLAAEGIRYANADESFVFWSKGDTAFVEEGPRQTVTYRDCVQRR